MYIACQCSNDQYEGRVAVDLAASGRNAPSQLIIHIMDTADAGKRRKRKLIQHSDAHLFFPLQSVASHVHLLTRLVFMKFQHCISQTQGPLNSLFDVEVVLPQGIFDGIIGQFRSDFITNDQSHLFKAIVHLGLGVFSVHRC